MQERRDLNDILEHLLVFDEIVTRLSTGFVNLLDHRLDDAIDGALEEIGRFAGVDRSYVFLFSDDLELASNTHEWCAEGIEPQIDDLQELPTSAFRWWMVRLTKFETVHLPYVDALPPEEAELREFLSSQGIQSLVAVPLIHRARLLGFVGFDAVHHPRPWAAREIRLLRLVGDIFANAIERRRAQKRLAEIEEQLHQAQKMEAIGKLAGGIAHDFNNYLTAIGGFAELLAAQLDGADGRRELAAEICRSTSRAQRLTQQLLAFSRPQAGRPELLDLNQVIRDSFPTLRQLTPEPIDLDLALCPSVTPIEIDRGHVEQIVTNLVVNARDAVRTGGTIRVVTGLLRLETRGVAALYGLEETGLYARLRVEDDGCGMDESVASRIFEPFFTTKPAGEGTGLGLATTYGLVKQARGGIRVESAPGEGTSMELILPARAEEEETTVVPSASAEHTASRSAPRRPAHSAAANPVIRSNRGLT